MIDKKYSVETGLYLEERSLSGGNNTLSNLIVFPKILLSVIDTVRLFEKEIGVIIKGGDLWNEDIGDFIRFYNIDYQGVIGKIIYKNWEASLMSIGDLSNSIGLDLHQTYRFALGYRWYENFNQLSITINELVTQPTGGHPTATDYNISNFAKFCITPKLNIHSQVETRINSKLGGTLAAAIKLSYLFENFKATASIRYFSSEFNLGYNGDTPNYSSLDNRFVGEQLYPLKNFYRNFSQYAVYTHMGNTDLAAIAITSQWNRKFYKKLGYFWDMDINYIIDVGNQNGLVFPIYDAGIQLNFTDDFIVRASLTNKHMDLSNFYQTFAISKGPFVALGVHLQIEKLKLRTYQIK